MKLKILYLITLTLATFLVGCSSEVIQDQDAITDTNVQLSAKEEFITLLNTNIDNYIVGYEYSGSTGGGDYSSTYSVVVVNYNLASYEEVHEGRLSGQGDYRTTTIYNGNDWQCSRILIEDNTDLSCTYERPIITDNNLKTEILSIIQVSNVDVISFDGTLGRKCFWYGEDIENNNDLKGVCFREDGFLVTRFQQFQLGNGVLNVDSYTLDEITKETAWNAVS